jgi:hypothetical protein
MFVSSFFIKISILMPKTSQILENPRILFRILGRSLVVGVVVELNFGQALKKFAAERICLLTAAAIRWGEPHRVHRAHLRLCARGGGPGALTLLCLFHRKVAIHVKRIVRVVIHEANTSRPRHFALPAGRRHGWPRDTQREQCAVLWRRLLR